MAIVSTEIKKYLSGGSSNTNPNEALGGAISSTEIVDDTLNNLFDKVTGSESEVGSIEYRAFFVKNTNATKTYEDAKIYISTNTASADTIVHIALADEAVGVSTIETIANEDTPPVGPTFSAPSSYATALSIGDIAPGAMKGIWVRWTVSALASAVLDEATIMVAGDTEA